MKEILLNKAHNISGFASEGDSRFALCGVHYDAARKVLEATNGRSIVEIPVIQVDDEFPLGPGLKRNDTGEPTSCTIPTRAFEAALESVPKRTALPILQCVKLTTHSAPTIACLESTDLDAANKTETKCIGGKFPNSQKLLDEYFGPPAKFSITMGAGQLVILADYLRDVGNKNVKLEFTGPIAPMRFTVEIEKGLTARGLIMPMRVE